MSKKKSQNATYEVIRKIRNDWGTVNPVTKVIPNKKKKNKKQERKEGKKICQTAMKGDKN